MTIFVLAYLMVLEGPKVVDGGLNLFPEDREQRIRAVGADCARTITGYISGNLLISAICGGLTYVVLLIAGVPFAGLIALFVAIADLIPLVGATLGAIVAAAAAFLHSVPAATRHPGDRVVMTSFCARARRYGSGLSFQVEGGARLVADHG